MIITGIDFKSDAFARAKERVNKDNIVAVFDPIAEVWYTNSASEPDTKHKVIVRPRYMCNCTGFWRTGMCKHLAAVFIEQKKRQHIWICPNCSSILYCHPTMPTLLFDKHMGGECDK